MFQGQGRNNYCEKPQQLQEDPSEHPISSPVKEQLEGEEEGEGG